VDQFNRNILAWSCEHHRVIFVIQDRTYLSWIS
jgi:hypothetical protein